MVEIEMRALDAGTVTLQDARGRSRRSVEVDAFEIGVYPVTEEILAELLGIEVRHPRTPATQLSWLRAVRLCNAASEWEGLDPVYGFDGADVTWHRDADGFRLPTEAEWEYACRAGSAAAHYGPLGEVAWTAADGVNRAQPVGGRMPNLHGLFDTLGNVWEWCWDLLDATGEDERRVFRGGSFASDAFSARASTRRGALPDAVGDDIGMRFARGPQEA